MLKYQHYSWYLKCIVLIHTLHLLPLPPLPVVDLQLEDRERSVVQGPLRRDGPGGVRWPLGIRPQAERGERAAGSEERARLRRARLPQGKFNPNFVFNQIVNTVYYYLVL